MQLVNKGIGNSFVMITHNGKSIPWDTKFADKSQQSKSSELFVEINGYWESLSSSDQDAIFEIYKEIREIFDDRLPTRRALSKELAPLVAKLLSYHGMSSINRWVTLLSNIEMPTDLEDEFVEAPGTGRTRSMTYTKDDYRKIVCLTLIIRVMYPIWGEFIKQITDEVGNDWKEYYAFYLLSQSHLFDGFGTDEYENPLNRLYIYIRDIIGSDTDIDHAIVGSKGGGISSEDYPIWLLAVVIVRRISIGEISSSDHSSKLIRVSVYGYIDQKINGSRSNGFMTDLRKKENITSSGDDPDALSVLESNKAREKFSVGLPVVVKFFLEDINRPWHALLKYVGELNPDGTTPVPMVANMLSAPDVVVEDIQVTLAEMVLSHVLFPGSLSKMPKINNITTINACVVAGAWLWKNQFYSLAAIVTATSVQDTDMSYRIDPESARDKLDKELASRIDELYPYRKRSGKKTDRRSEGQICIDLLTDRIGQYSWKVTIPREVYAGILDNSIVSGLFVVPRNIRTELALLAIRISEDKARVLKLK